MAGIINKMICTIIAQRSKGNPTIGSTTRTKLILKGIDPSKYTPSSPDDPVVIENLKLVAKELSVTL